MKILFVTPIYYIEGRDNLFHDSNAVHYLIKNWAMEHEVVVFHIYSQSFTKIKRYTSRDERAYYRYGYMHSVDNVKVFMLEVQRFIKQQAILNGLQARRAKKYLMGYLETLDFVPDVIVTHMPTSFEKLLNSIFLNTPKMAVLHTTDVLNVARNPRLADEMDDIYDDIYSRSNPIRNMFDGKFKNLRSSLVVSGAPMIKNIYCLQNKPKVFNILYVGKLIKRKNVDKVLIALSKLEKKYAFEFSIYGDGIEKENLVCLSNKTFEKPIVRFYDPISHEAVIERMKKNNIFVMVSEKETLGLVYLEAMACGNIVIGTKDEGIDGIIEDKNNGFLIQANDVNKLVETFERVFNMVPSEYVALSQNAKASANYYNEIDMGRLYLELIKKTCIRS